MIDEGNELDVVYMDFSEVFEKVPDGRLGQKMKSHGTSDHNISRKMWVLWTGYRKGLPERMRDFSYEEKLDKLGLFLQQSRSFTDELIEIYKIVNSMDR
eukprot:g33337.t1